MAFSSLDEKPVSGRKSLPKVTELVGGRVRTKGRVPTPPPPLVYPNSKSADGPSNAMTSKLFTFRSRTFFSQHLKQKEPRYIKQPAALAAGWALWLGGLPSSPHPHSLHLTVPKASGVEHPLKTICPVILTNSKRSLKNNYFYEKQG